jgi:serine/threonine protein kinase
MARVLVANKYQLLKKIGAGSFGKIFAAKLIDLDQSNNKETDADADAKYAIKITAVEHTHKNEVGSHKNEVAIYEKLKGIKNIPTLYAAGTEGKFNYIVMDLLEQSMEQLRQDYGEQMSLKVVVHLALQMLTIVEEIHTRGIIHCDLKPANFLLKTNARQISELYLIDFGLAKSFLDEKSRHVTIKTNEPMVGTIRYMSLNTHHGLTASRRDDLESIGYILLFLYHGQLSWQNQSSVAQVVELKQNFGFIMNGSNTIGEFILFLLYCRNLSFTDKPNYTYLRGLLDNLNKL